jgi:glycoprotein endo-alpha-1,2-mannosidase
MIRTATVDAIVVPWAGVWASNGTSSFTDDTIKLLFRLAPEYSLRIIPLFSRFEGRNKTSFLADLTYYRLHYANESAHYRRYNKAMGIVYNAHELRGSLEILESASEMSFMATAYGQNDFLGAFEDGYCGFLTFFGSDESSWGSRHSNWPILRAIARERGVEFVPTVAPGYNDSLIERWSGRLSRARNCSDYFDATWKDAIDTRPEAIFIHSFNAWDRGSVIEPAVDNGKYVLSNETWCEKDSDFYLRKTKEWIARFKR